MAKLKSYVTKTSRIKNGKSGNGSRNFINYLLDKNRPAHTDTEIIKLTATDKNDFLEYVDWLVDSKNEGCKSKVRSNLQSFTFNLPNSLPGQEKFDWYKFEENVRNYLAENYNIDRKCVFSVIHKEKPPKHSHLNMVVSRVIPVVNGLERKFISVKALDQKKLLYGIRNVFNQYVEKSLNVSKDDYVIENRYNSKDLPLHMCRQIEARKAQEQISDYKANFEETYNQAKHDINISNWATAEKLKAESTINTFMELFKKEIDFRKVEKNRAIKIISSKDKKIEKLENTFFNKLKNAFRIYSKTQKGKEADKVVGGFVSEVGKAIVEKYDGNKEVEAIYNQYIANKAPEPIKPALPIPEPTPAPTIAPEVIETAVKSDFRMEEKPVYQKPVLTERDRLRDEYAREQLAKDLAKRKKPYKERIKDKKQEQKKSAVVDNILKQRQKVEEQQRKKALASKNSIKNNGNLIKK